ncbi:protein max-like [Cotesia typhae]|uniref:protein max-like n=1 Tax=Cotesia typhae TaxID=2053667 RepID=UPI003D6864C6
MGGKNLELVEKYYKSTEELEIEPEETESEESLHNYPSTSRGNAGSIEERKQIHNFLERKRRDGIKLNFGILQETVNELDEATHPAKGRIKVLRKTIDFIRRTNDNILSLEHEVQTIEQENRILQADLMSLGGDDSDSADENEATLDS